jgi:hypothetical protein
MCPACMASAASFAVGVTSGGGMLAIVVARFRKLKHSLRLNPRGKSKEKQS